MSIPPAPRLREDEIRPAHALVGQAERFAADVARLLAHRHNFIPVPCPACMGTQVRPAFEKLGLRYVVCVSCETMFVSPRPSPEDLRRYYETSENYAYWNTHIFPASEAARREKVFRPRAERIVDIARRYGKETGVLLEVGAGFGTFCEEVQRLGGFRRVIAVEPTPDLARTCRARGLEVLEQPIEAVALPEGSVDVIASFEVIEHLFSPRDYVARCRQFLGVGGLLVLTCPNVKGFDIAVLGDLSESVDAEHLNYFHPDSLSRLVGGLGFDVLEVTTPGRLDAELVRKHVLAGRLDLDDQPFLRAVLLDRWDELGDVFQDFLARHGLSSHLWLVAQKQ